MDTDPRTAALEFLKKHKTGALATLTPDGTAPRVRLVYYSSDELFNIYFMTLATMRKAWDLKEHPQAAFAVSAEEVPQTLQLEGTVEDITDQATADDEAVVTLFKNLSSNAKYYAPIARFDQADVRYFKLTPNWVRFGDFTSGTHTEEVLKGITP